MKKFIIIITTFLLVMSTITAARLANAGNIKKNDQQLVIAVDENGCAKSVDLASEVDNCDGTEYAQSCGKNGKDCICMQNQKFVSWTSENDSRFELVFHGASPFKENCKVKSGNNARIRCKIDAPDADYDYDVILESCPGQEYDPRIVLRTMN